MPANIEITDRFQRRESTEGEGAAGEYYVLDLDSGRYYAIGEVGGFVWERLDGSRELTVIAGEVSREFEVGQTQAEGDVLEFVASLTELGLIEACE